MAILQVPGGELFYEVEGDGVPVVLVHGLRVEPSATEISESFTVSCCAAGAVWQATCASLNLRMPRSMPGHCSATPSCAGPRFALDAKPFRRSGDGRRDARASGDDPFARLFPGTVVETGRCSEVPPPGGPVIERWAGAPWPGGRFA